MSEQLPALLLASLNPATRKQAEQNLHALSVQPGFLPVLLRLVLEASQDRSVRLAASVFFKNVVKNKWEDVRQAPVPEADKAALRNALVAAMIQLSTPSDKAVRAQIAESISLIASADFPERWSDLIDNLVGSLSPTNYAINIGVLQTAHSIFSYWRAATRSDALFTVINLVLKSFSKPLLQLLQHTSNLLLTNAPGDATSTPELRAQAQVLLVDLYYDLTCQDLPPDFEDTHAAFFGPPEGLFLKFLVWDPPQLQGDPDDTTASLPSQIKTGMLEIAELHVKLYPEVMQASGAVPALVSSVWDLIGGGRRTSIGDDGLVSQSLRFISTAIRSGHYKELFSSKDTISNLLQGVVVPNIVLREHDIEQFEDDPLEYIRTDLSLPAASGLGLGSHDAMTRRQAAADLVRALVSSGLEAETTEVAGAYINQGLQDYNNNKTKEDSWKSKNTAVYLLTAVATRGSTTQQGVTSTNALVDVVKFFSDHIFQDLQAPAGSVHPLLQVDAIRYLYTFRTQLTKPQLLSVLPLLVTHLNSDNYVCYTYAAISIERILFIKQANQLLFSQADVHESARPLIDALLKKIEQAGTPEKVAENDYLMRCVMRVIITARSSLVDGYDTILTRLVNILGVISKNPSNPNFDQYIFESISALIRFIVSARADTLPTFEQALFGPFTFILQSDIDQYIPYVFQLLAQMLDLHTQEVPAAYRELLPFLLTPAAWTQKGSIPGLVKLLKAFLTHDSQHIVANNQHLNVYGIIQTLLKSKANDAWGFELLQAAYQSLPQSALADARRVLIMAMLTRLQTSKTDKFVYYFVLFLLFVSAINVEGLTPDFTVEVFEGIQPNLWPQILSNFVLPQVPKLPTKDRKLAAVGLTKLLTQSTHMLREPVVQAWPATFTALARLFSEPQYLTKNDEDPDAVITSIDFEEQNAGYQAAYSRLAASEGAQVDPVAYVRDPREFLGQELVRLSKTDPRVKLLLTANPEVAPFVQSLANSGYVV
ncbi:importin alpha re-exporter [Irpex lacteus]|nr:importin alpha re-exporter [Irpex lacteus]